MTLYWLIPNFFSRQNNFGGNIFGKQSRFVGKKVNLSVAGKKYYFFPANTYEWAKMFGSGKKHFKVLLGYDCP